jgi:hypothetical protein
MDIILVHIYSLAGFGKSLPGTSAGKLPSLYTRSVKRSLPDVSLAFFRLQGNCVLNVAEAGGRAGLAAVDKDNRLYALAGGLRLHYIDCQSNFNDP